MAYRRSRTGYSRKRYGNRFLFVQIVDCHSAFGNTRSDFVCTKRNRLPETDYHDLAEKAYRSGLQAVLPKKGAECIVEEEEGSHGHYSECGYGASVVPD